ncbi:MAG TPA: type II secretion system F family protein [Candidatus Paceibacterota bacterium]|nr:type II secretion system F family protein [Candidatus Paceibacterota bacterium]HRZ29558.1 type II secretion system F family protein [Candidatus Paceibacterota bacterium]
MLFHYTAFDTRNVYVEGDIDMPTLEDVLKFLNNQQLKPIKVVPINLKAQAKSLTLFQRRISLMEQIFLFKYLGLMLKVGTDILKAVDVLMQDYDKGPVKNFLLQSRSNLEKGSPFYITFEQNKKVFSYVTINLIKAGEKSGTLQITLEKISINLEKDKDLRGKIISALTYPVLLLSLMLVLMVFLMIFLLPKMGASFTEAGLKLPAFTKMLFSVSTYFNAHMVPVLATFFGVPIVLGFYFFKTDIGKKQFNKFIRLIPPIRNFLNKMALQRLTGTLSSLIKAGMPLVESLKITSESVGEDIFRISLSNVATYLTQGLTVGEAFRQEKSFPRYLSNLLAIGEKAGHIDEILATMSDFYEKEIEASLKSLVALIEPVMLIFMGAAIGGIAVSVILPMYQMMGSI